MGQSGKQRGNFHPMSDTGHMMSYLGEFVHQLDARSRVTVPSSWRTAGDEGIYYWAWPHPEGCIAVYPPHMQAELLEKARSVQQSDVRGQTLLRKLFGRASKFGCDKQGRILIPDPLKQHAGIEKKVSLVGLGHYFQVWDAAKREAEDDDFDLLEAMAQMGI